MKKIISLMLVFEMLFVFAGCGDKEIDKNRILYNVDLSKYLELSEYKGIKVDTATDEFETSYNQTITDDISDYDLCVKITEGTVKDGDTVNIDYVGKKNGVAFEGGTASGYDLTIGSGTFIDGFEEGLVGVAVGSEVDLNLTFPEDYGNEELNGAAVVFTVTVNYIATEESLTPEEYYSQLGFESVEDYYADVKERTIKQYLLETILEDTKINKYTKTDVENVYEIASERVKNNITSSYGIDFETYLDYYGQTEDDFKEEIISKQIEPLMDNLMPIYAILDAENMTVTEKEVDKKLKEMAENIGSMTEEQIEESYGRFYIESLVVMDKVLDIAYKNAKIS